MNIKISRKSMKENMKISLIHIIKKFLFNFNHNLHPHLISYTISKLKLPNKMTSHHISMGNPGTIIKLNHHLHKLKAIFYNILLKALNKLQLSHMVERKYSTVIKRRRKLTKYKIIIVKMHPNISINLISTHN